MKRHGYFKLPALTKKRFKRYLAVLGVLALWVAALSLMVLPSSRASAERGTGSQSHNTSSTPKGAGTTYRTTIGEALFLAGAKEVKADLRELCVNFLPRCHISPLQNLEVPDLHGSGISIASGGFSQGDSYPQRTGNEFSAGDRAGNAFSNAFGGSGFSSSGFGYNAFQRAELNTSEKSPDFVASLPDGPEPDDQLASDPALEEAANPSGPVFIDEPPFVAGLIAPPGETEAPGPPTGRDPSGSPTTALPTPTVTVPEPITLLIFGAGLLGIFASRTKRIFSGRKALSAQ